jgi:hypothetical protein
MSQAKTLRDFVLRRYRSGLKATSIRFLYYDAITDGIIAKDADLVRKDNALIQATKTLRDTGDIPWDWITDETRSVEDYTGFDTIKAGVLAYLPSIDLDPWKGRPPFIITESRSLLGTIRADLPEYALRGASVNGPCTGFLHTKVGPMLEQCFGPVLYFGDLDRGGKDIEAHIKRTLEKILGREFGSYWERLAITPKQVTRFRLESKPKRDKRDDKRADAWEAEALGQQRLITILRRRLDALLPQSLNKVQASAKRQRRKIMRALAKV